MSVLSQSLTLALFLLLSGFFSGAEVALVSLPRMRIQSLVDQNLLGSHYVKRLKEDPQRMLATILIGNNIVNVGAAAIATSIAISIFDNFAVGIATGVMTILILVFGEITPKSIAAQHNEVVSRLVSPVIWYLSIVLAPILFVLDTFLNAFMGMLGIKSKKRMITEEEVRSMIQTAQEEGAIKEIEKEMINSIFEFDDISVGEILTPRADMAMLPFKSTIGDVSKVMEERKFSRIPIYKKHKDNVVGVVYVKDLIPYFNSKGKSTSIAKIMHKPYIVPESKKISSLLRHFQRYKDQMAIVVNEHGTMLGLVTIEDVLEEIVGEIMDETDTPLKHVVKKGRNKWIVSGKTEVEEFNKKLHVRIKGDEYDTISGFILDQVGKIPRQGERVEYNGLAFTIQEVNNRRIAKVLVEKTKVK